MSGSTMRMGARATGGAALLITTAGLVACAAPSGPGPRLGLFEAQAAQVTASVPPRPPGRYKLGAPYQAGGVWYVPAEQPGYDAVGVAAWYGGGYHGRATADGERFDAAALTAAHPTLPLPSMVEVTNFGNGRSIQVRVNDRGAFRPGRVVDLSRGAAEQLGFVAQGTAKVRVRYLGPAPLDPAAAPTTAMALELPPPRPPRRERGALLAPPAALSGEGGYAVQVGAFAERDRADRTAARLATAGPATVRALDQPGGRLFRVIVGPWPDAAAATQARARTVALGFTDARVVQAF